MSLGPVRAGVSSPTAPLSHPKGGEPSVPASPPPSQKPAPFARIVAQRSELGLEAAPHLDSYPEYRALEANRPVSPALKARLEALCTQPLADGIDRDALIRGTLRELSDSGSIRQGDHQTCAAATIQIALAEEDPEEYVRLLQGLASPAGQVRTTSGEVLTRQPLVGSGDRSVGSELMQASFMSLAAPGYDAIHDTRATREGVGQGLTVDETARLRQAVTGRDVRAVSATDPACMDEVRRSLDTGQPVSALLRGTDASGRLQGHAVLVTSIDNGLVRFKDPSGKQSLMTLERFQAQLDSAVLPTAIAGSRPAGSSPTSRLLAGSFDFFSSLGSVVGGVIGGAIDRTVDAVMRPVTMLASAGTALVGLIGGSAASQAAPKVAAGGGGTSPDAAMSPAINTCLGGAAVCLFIPGLQGLAIGLGLMGAVLFGAKTLFGWMSGGSGSREEGSEEPSSAEDAIAAGNPPQASSPVQGGGAAEESSEVPRWERDEPGVDPSVMRELRALVDRLQRRIGSGSYPPDLAREVDRLRHALDGRDWTECHRILERLQRGTRPPEVNLYPGAYQATILAEYDPDATARLRGPHGAIDVQIELHGLVSDLGTGYTVQGGRLGSAGRKP